MRRTLVTRHQVGGSINVFNHGYVGGVTCSISLLTQARVTSRSTVGLSTRELPVLRSTSRFLNRVRGNVTFGFFAHVNKRRYYQRSTRPVIRTTRCERHRIRQGTAANKGVLSGRCPQLARVLRPFALGARLFPFCRLFVKFSSFSVVLRVVIGAVEGEIRASTWKLWWGVVLKKRLRRSQGG